MKTIGRAAKIFTSTVDERTAALVSRIQGSHDRFATDFIGAGSNDETAVAVRLEAWQSAETGLWGIDRFTYAPALDTINQAVEASPVLCFFDALEYCARFQADEINEITGRGIIHVPGERWQSIPSYREAAAAAHQVIGRDGLVRPCAGGRILMPGSFSVAAMETALGVLALPALVGDLLTANTPVPADERVRRYIDKRLSDEQVQAQIKQCASLLSAGRELKQGVTELAKRKFKSNIPVISSVLTLGLAPALGYLGGFPRYAPKRYFSHLKLIFDDAVRAMPGGPEKTLAGEFSKAAESMCLLERAISILKADVRVGKHSGEAVENAMACVDRAAEIAGMAPLDAERLKNDYLGAGFAPMTFAEKLEAPWNICAESLCHMINRLEGGTLLKGDERIGDLLSDGTVYGGVSPDTNRPMFIAPADLPMVRSWPRALDAVAGLKNYHGHDGNARRSEKEISLEAVYGPPGRGWRLPTLKEIDILHRHKETGALKGTFDEAVDDAGYAVSHLIEGNGIKCKFSQDIHEPILNKIRFCSYGSPLFIRCVRS